MEGTELEGNIQVTVRDEETFCDKAYFLCCHPTGKAHRFIALVLMCFLGFGSYFCYDNPGALQGHFKTDLNITETQFTGLYSIYSWPNVIMCFVGGFMLDRVFGIIAGTNIFMGLTLMGQLIFAFAAYIDQYWLLMCGRFIFGVGAESLAVAQNNYAVLWFRGKELNMVFGLQLSFARLGSTVNFWVMEDIYKWVSGKVLGSHILGYALLIATSTCFLSMACSLILGLMERRADRIMRRSETQSTEVVRITDIKDFKLSFWLVSCICVSYYVAIFPFINIGQDFFEKRFHMSVVDADKINSLVYLISGIASPITGFLIDKVGLNILWILLSVIASTIAHVLLGFTMVNPYIAISILGIAYSGLASGLWPMVALMIPEYQLGTAYGVCQAIQNLGLAVVTIISGIIQQTWGYRVLSEFFICSLLCKSIAKVGKMCFDVLLYCEISVAFLFTAILLLLDQQQNGILNLTPAGRRRHQEILVNNILERQRILAEEEAASRTEPPQYEFGLNNEANFNNSRHEDRYLNSNIPSI